jgi:hypothetical protein
LSDALAAQFNIFVASTPFFASISIIHAASCAEYVVSFQSCRARDDNSENSCFVGCNTAETPLIVFSNPMNVWTASVQIFTMDPEIAAPARATSALVIFDSSPISSNHLVTFLISCDAWSIASMMNWTFWVDILQSYMVGVLFFLFSQNLRFWE